MSLVENCFTWNFIICYYWQRCTLDILYIFYLEIFYNLYNVATSCREKEKLVHSVTLIDINYTDRNELGRKFFYLEFYYLLLLTALYFGYFIYFLLGNFL